MIIKKFLLFLIFMVYVLLLKFCSVQFNLDESGAEYNISGSMSGLAGLVTISNDGDSLLLTANSNFTFANEVSAGQTYSVTVLSQPTGQTCIVSNGSGTISERMRITSSGNVGIGTTNPTMKLVVVGEPNVTGNMNTPDDIFHHFGVGCIFRNSTDNTMNIRGTC